MPSLRNALLLAQDEGPVDHIVGAVESAWNGFLRSLPGLASAVVILLIAWVVGRGLRRRLEPQLTALRTPSFGHVFATLAYVGVVVVGVMIALPLAIPSLSLGAVLGGLGLLGVAAGFAFQDILSNLLAGLLLIFRQPFVSGDQIEVAGHRGTVDTITIRETRLRTFGGRLVVIPNSDVYSNAITVQTAQEAVRTSFVTGVAYGSDLDLARKVALETLADVEGVHEEPAPQAYYIEHGASSVGLDLRYWTSSRQAEVRATQDRVVAAVHDAFEDAGIDIPFDIVTLDVDDSFARVFDGRG